jgi:DNA-binding MarR family transcriptional regulator
VTEMSFRMLKRAEDKPKRGNTPLVACDVQALPFPAGGPPGRIPLTPRVITHIFRSMSTRLRDEIKQTRPFSSPGQEAFLSLGRTWAVLEHALAEALKPRGITPTQYNVLRILRGAGEKGLCRGEVMERMIARVPDATRLLDRMEAAGLIERARDAEDRRFVTTRITDKGLRVLGELDEPVLALHRQQFAALNEEDLRSLIELLGRARESA